jgi:hypothetical protein
LVVTPFLPGDRCCSRAFAATGALDGGPFVLLAAAIVGDTVNY